MRVRAGPEEGPQPGAARNREMPYSGVSGCTLRRRRPCSRLSRKPIRLRSRCRCWSKIHSAHRRPSLDGSATSALPATPPDFRIWVTVRLFGPTAEWFVSLGAAITGRSWSLVTAAQAGTMLGSGPVLVKLADAKRREMPARRYLDVAAFDTATAGLKGAERWELLATTGWFDIDSEYRVFTYGRDVLTASPYWVRDEPWTPLLYTHRASLHIEAAPFVQDFFLALPADALPPRRDTRERHLRLIHLFDGSRRSPVTDPVAVMVAMLVDDLSAGRVRAG